MIISNDRLPEYMREHSVHIQSQWRHVYNTVFEKTGSVERAVLAANSVLSKRNDKTEDEKFTRHDRMLFLMNKFLKNV